MFDKLLAGSRSDTSGLQSIMAVPGEERGENALSVIIPIYNEVDNIPALYAELTEALKNFQCTYEILFIDDGSTDGSFELLCDMCSRFGRLKVVRFNRNYGQSAAMSAGFDLACGDYVITMDGDLQNDPADIPRLLEKMSEGYDVVCGWRANRKDSPEKKIFSKISNLLRSNLIGEKIHDSGCTLRAYKGECIKDIEVFGESHRYIPAMMRFNGYNVGEIKVNHRERPHGKSKYGLSRLVKGFSDLIAVVFWNRFATRPMHIFGAIGILIGAIGSISLAYLILNRLLFNASLADRPLFTLSILATIVGLQFIALGILADISLKIYYDQKHIKNYRISKIIESAPATGAPYSYNVK